MSVALAAGDLESALVAGATIRVFFNQGNPNNRLEHIRAIVDHDRIVSRRWDQVSWVYRVEHLNLYETLAKGGYLFLGERS